MTETDPVILDDSTRVPGERAQVLGEPRGLVASSPTGLRSVAAARAAIESAQDLPAITGVIDTLAVLRVAARKAKLSLDQQNDWAALKLEAQRKAGSMLADLRHDGRLRSGRPNADISSGLDDLGISQQQSSRWQRLAAVPSDLFTLWLEQTRASESEVTEVGLLTLSGHLQAAASSRPKYAGAREPQPLVDVASVVVEGSDDADDRIRTWPEDCITGMRRHVVDGTVDLIVADTPFGCEGHTLDRHYARDENYVVPGYVEVPRDEYPAFSRAWIAEAARVLRPGGSIYVISGYTGLRDVLNALVETDLVETNHLIWKYGFGVFAAGKWVSSHYHVLYWIKPAKGDIQVTFHTNARFADATDSYHDREDVLEIPREYQPGVLKNKNQLPEALVERLIAYSSNRGDVVLDPFLGGFTTAHVALRLGRKAWGFEINPNAYDAFEPGLHTIVAEPTEPPAPPDPPAFAKRMAMRQRRQEVRSTRPQAVAAVARQRSTG